MVNIILSEQIGFCSGVKRCIKLAEDILKENSGKVYAFGELLHNSEEMERLKKNGMVVVEDVSKVEEGSYVIVRAHGLGKNVLEEMEKKNIRIIDGTCPIVKRNQKLAMEYSSKGYNIIIYGDINHPEIKALLSYITPKIKIFVIKSLEEIDTINFDTSSRVVLIGQTTKELNHYRLIAEKLKEKFNNIVVLDTICKETILRENSVSLISKKTDVVLVVGGKNSANTRKLVDIASRSCKKVFHINNVEELSSLDILKNTTIGIVSGASTPLWLVENIVSKLKNI